MSDVRMTRCIEREAAQKIICGWCGICQHPTMEDLETCDDICPQFAEIPDADVRPVVRGYWHGEGDGYADGELVCDMWQCSCCGEWFDEWDDKPTWNFCPNCGADMRGGDGNG